MAGRAKVISFINYKGGVGKTTTTYHIGCSLAQHHNKKVLFIDIDPQTNLTFLCATPPEWKKWKQARGTIKDIYKRFTDKKPLDTKRFVWQNPINTPYGSIQNLDLIPCDVDLLGEDLGGGQITGVFPSFELLQRQAKDFLRERQFLCRVISEVEEKYDYILIDCPPNLYLMTQNALVASDYYVITAIPDHLSTIGLNILQQKVDKIGALIKKAATIVNEQANIAILGGIIFVKIRIGASVITNTHNNKMADISRSHINICFQTYTTEMIGYGEAAENCLPVWEHSSQNAKRAANKGEYQKITQEFLRRFN